MADLDYREQPTLYSTPFAIVIFNDLQLLHPGSSRSSSSSSKQARQVKPKRASDQVLRLLLTNSSFLTLEEALPCRIISLGFASGTNGILKNSLNCLSRTLLSPCSPNEKWIRITSGKGKTIIQVHYLKSLPLFPSSHTISYSSRGNWRENPIHFHGDRDTSYPPCSW